MSHSQLLFPDDLRDTIRDCLARYPTKQAATLPALHLVNDSLGFVPHEAVVELAELLELAPAQVQDTLGFYGMFKQDKPRGKHQILICRSITCAACGGEELLDHVCKRLGIQPGRTTADGNISIDFAECLGACDCAPAAMVDDKLRENMTPEKIEKMIDAWK